MSVGEGMFVLVCLDGFLAMGMGAMDVLLWGLGSENVWLCRGVSLLDGEEARR